MSNIFSKKKTNKKLKELSNDEIKNKKDELKKRKKVKNRKVKDKKITKQAKIKKSKEKQNSRNNIIKSKKIVNKPNEKLTDICTILEKCSIDEISKFLVKQGNKRKFPDITIREN